MTVFVYNRNKTHTTTTLLSYVWVYTQTHQILGNKTKTTDHNNRDNNEQTYHNQY